MGINWTEEEIGKNQYEWTPPSAQEIVDTIDEVDESQKKQPITKNIFCSCRPVV